MKGKNFFSTVFVSVVFVFIGVVMFQYYKTAGFYGTYNYAQYAFTYQKFGFITRGLFPSVLQTLQIKNTIVLLCIFTLSLAGFVGLLFKISRFNETAKWTYVVFFFFFSRGSTFLFRHPPF